MFTSCKYAVSVIVLEIQSHRFTFKDTVWGFVSHLLH